MKKVTVKWIPFLLAVCMFSAAANIVARKTINRLEAEIRYYEQINGILKQKITDCISDRDAAVDAAKPKSE